MRSWIVFALVVGCGKSASSPAPTPVKVASDAAGPIDAPAPPIDDCAKLTRAECLASDACTLHRVASNRYQCRADATACEIGIRQQDQAACTAKPGCVFTIANCYCECPGSGTAEVPDVIPPGTGCGCACGTGPPSMCTLGSTM